MGIAGRDMDTTKDVYPYLAFVMLFKLVIFVFEAFLDFRQYAKFKDMQVPADIRGFVKEKVFRDSQAYNKDMKKFSIIKSFVDFVWEMASLYFLLLAFIWEYEAGIAYIGLDPTNEIYKAFFTFFCLYMISTVMSIPWSLYSNFVIKQKHGFNIEGILIDSMYIICNI